MLEITYYILFNVSNRVEILEWVRTNGVPMSGYRAVLLFLFIFPICESFFRCFCDIPCFFKLARARDRSYAYREPRRFVQGVTKVVARS